MAHASTGRTMHVKAKIAHEDIAPWSICVETSGSIEIARQGTPRWRWEDVDRKLSGRKPVDTGAAMRGAFNFGRKKRDRHASA